MVGVVVVGGVVVGTEVVGGELKEGDRVITGENLPNAAPAASSSTFRMRLF